MKNKFTSIFGLAMVLVLMLAINLLGSLLGSNVKADLTEEKLYTLSGGTKNILGNLDDQITAKLYYSKTAVKDIPQFKTYAARVIDMLKAYEQASKGKIRLEVIDPRPDTEEQEWADRSGLKAIPAGNEMIYLGLALRDESGHEQSIAFFRPDREPFIEYDVTKALQQVSQSKKKQIGVISSLPLFGAPATPPNPMMPEPEAGKPWFAIRQLRQSGYEVKEIDISEHEIPAGLDLLLIVHPKNLNTELQYSIDQYVLNGGNALVFVDPFCEADQESSSGMNPQMRMQMTLDSDLPQLFKAWGIQLASGTSAMSAGEKSSPKIVADPSLSIKVQTQDGRPADLIVWLSLGEQNRNKDEIVTAELESVMLATPGKLEKTSTNDSVTITPLLTTSAGASLVDSFMLKFGINPEQLQKEFTPGSVEIPLAYKISGTFDSAFPAGKPQAEPKAGETEPETPPQAAEHLGKSKTAATIIVVADADLLSDRMSVRVQNFFGQEIANLMNDNLSFLTNAVENLTGSQDLISLRSRGKSQRPFTRVQEIERAAQEKWRVEEENLNAKLEAANKRLDEIKQGTNEKQILNQALMAEIEKVRNDRANMQQQLRAIRLKLREDVERLAARLKFINIALIPLLVILFGGALALSQSFRRRSA